MADAYHTGDKVAWSWGAHEASGEIRAVHRSDIRKTIKGTEVKRTASEDCPAYTIEQEDGDVVLKSHNEVRKVS